MIDPRQDDRSQFLAGIAIFGLAALVIVLVAISIKIQPAPDVVPPPPVIEVPEPAPFVVAFIYESENQELPSYVHQVRELIDAEVWIIDDDTEGVTSPVAQLIDAARAGGLPALAVMGPGGLVTGPVPPSLDAFMDVINEPQAN